MSGEAAVGGGPAVSVVMPARDETERIGGAIESVLAQGYRSWELVVVEDGSGDGTPEVVRRYDDPRIRMVPGPASGFPAALNRGLAVARAPLIARLDADDRMMPERLARQVAAMEARPGLGLLGARAVYAFEDGSQRIPGGPTKHEEIVRFLLRDNPFVHSSVMLRRSALDAVGRYDPEYGPDVDYELWVRIAARFETAILPEPLVRYAVRARSLSRDRPRSEAVRRRLAVQRRAAAALGGGARARWPLLRSRLALRTWRALERVGVA